MSTRRRRVYVHPNTFRYRLRRLSEVGEVDLGDTDARFAMMLQLRTVVKDISDNGFETARSFG